MAESQKLDGKKEKLEVEDEHVAGSFESDAHSDNDSEELKQQDSENEASFQESDHDSQQNDAEDKESDRPFEDSSDTKELSDKELTTNEPRNEKKIREEMAKRDRERLRKIKQRQKEALDNLRKLQNKEIEAAQEKSAQQRLKYLLDQTEIFTHFVKGPLTSSQSSIPNEASTGGTPTKRRRSSGDLEANDEDEDANQEETSQFITIWTVSPPFVRGEMRDYQIHGLNWLIKLYDNGINGILADEMGLGKTLQTVAFLAYLKEIRGINGPHLVIAPKSTLGNWKKEFQKWVPTMNFFCFHGNKEERAELKATKLQPGKFDVCITTYEIAIREKNALKKFRWRYLIIDEAHRIKNEKSVLATVVRIYSSQYRLLLTGTPLQNNLHELWALLNFLLPDVFSSSEDFDSWFQLRGSDVDQTQEIINKLHKVLRPFLLRRLKSEVAQGLPPKREIKLWVGLTKLQKEIYQRILTRDIDVINGVQATRTRLLNIVMQLRKVCNHPYLFHGVEPGPPFENGDHLITTCGKMMLLDKLLKRLKERGSQVLLFSQMTRLLDILEDYLTWRGYEYCRIDGSTTTFDREEQIDAFTKPGSTKFVFLLSTRAGGLGINLASADTVILYDSDWNPQVDLQAQDRAHRIGQTKPVFVYRFVTEGTIEEVIIERAETKLRLDALVIQQGRLVEQNKPLTKDDMLAMIKYGAEEIFANKEGTYTDEDIDRILQRGEQRTEELNQKYAESANSLWKMFSTEGKSVYHWEGKDWSLEAQKKLAKKILVMPKRERKQALYNETQYFKVLLGTGGEKKKKEAHLRPPKQPIVYPFQFYPKRLYELLEKETEAYRRKVELREKREEEKSKETENRKTEKKSDEDKTEEETKEEESIKDLTESEQQEKERLLEKGFGNWNKREFNAFLKGCEKYGRWAIASIAADIETKSEAEVREYAKVFWKRYKEIPEYEKFIQNIERGEQKIARRKEMIAALAYKVERAQKDPFKNLKINYGSNKGKMYTEEEDIFLLCATHAVGYGNWEEVKREIRKSWRFRFDWFFKSRTPAELQRRTDTLIRLIEKELAEKNMRPNEQKKSSSKKTKKSEDATQSEKITRLPEENNNSSKDTEQVKNIADVASNAKTNKQSRSEPTNNTFNTRKRKRDKDEEKKENAIQTKARGPVPKSARTK
jgi:SWI/SNF-related matrix-associated actin-dependent regulator of chromatin subfamily A member 5